MLWWALYKAEGVLEGSRLRKTALAECMKHIHYEVCPLMKCLHTCTDSMQEAHAMQGGRHGSVPYTAVAKLTRKAQVLLGIIY